MFWLNQMFKNWKMYETRSENNKSSFLNKQHSTTICFELFFLMFVHHQIFCKHHKHNVDILLILWSFLYVFSSFHLEHFIQRQEKLKTTLVVLWFLVYQRNAMEKNFFQSGWIKWHHRLTLRSKKVKWLKTVCEIYQT